MAIPVDAGTAMAVGVGTAVCILGAGTFGWLKRRNNGSDNGCGAGAKIVREHSERLSNLETSQRFIAEGIKDIKDSMAVLHRRFDALQDAKRTK